MALIVAALLLISGVPLNGMAAAGSGSRPTIGSFVAAPAKATLGQPSTLSWSVTGATTLAINPGVGAVSGTSVTVRPSATTSYTLTATNSFGTATAAVTVMVGSPPTITGFTASPAKVASGRSSFVYIARDFAEVQAVYQPIERSINHFVNAEQIDTTTFRFQVPFLPNTQDRASIDALLADLDGNRTPP